ncbi:hypothetical protein, conserved [Eimeria necatrix]|uniref:Uncharacterized protein n=1 Tax=Eimeria necatrix TaxID=51315 RepID=U6N0P3_9EIME|nr:hypothetical protein, conserved [Eimeria necatrix]CDJ70018.1 hypothetical protein, conserved [Eimeria necatrix]
MATSPPSEAQQATVPSLPLPVPRVRLRLDRRLLLVYGLLLLDVVMIGITSLQHVWQPANLIDKVLQNHNAPLHADTSPALQPQLPVAVKRELGMSCCCGWLALAVMGILSLLVSYSPSSLDTVATAPSVSAKESCRGQGSPTTTTARRSRPLAVQTKDSGKCAACLRTVEEVELQVKLKYLLVAVASFCVFFALNLIVQIHGRFQQSKVTVAALKTFAAENTENAQMISSPGLYGLEQRDPQGFPYDAKQSNRVDGVYSASDAKGGAQLFVGEMPSQDTFFPQGVHPQSPSYFYWRDFRFWMELGRECFLDGEIQLSGLWVVLHLAALLGGRGFLHSPPAMHVSAE